MSGEQGSLYTMSSDVPELERPILLHALPGMVDAGHAVRLANDHLLSSLTSTVIARFDHDVLIDYRGGRPSLVFATDRYEDYVVPEITLRAVEDAAGQHFLLLTGREPDFQWDRFIESVIEIIERFDVRLSLGLLAIPMAVPHTRPLSVTGHGTRTGLVPTDGNFLRGNIQVPATIGSLLELRLGAAGFDAAGFAAHVPHYLAATQYPDAAITLLERVAAVTGLTLPTEDLSEVAVTTRREVDLQVAASDEVREIVGTLEKQYDATVATGSDALLRGDQSLPDADQIGAELERFLAGLEEGGSNKG
jgi:proteasome assembly chaperone (PAC2) family protein